MDSTTIFVKKMGRVSSVYNSEKKYAINNIKESLFSVLISKGKIAILAHIQNTYY